MSLDIDHWLADVRADTEWMATEAADVMATRDPDGELVKAAERAQRVLESLAGDHTLAECLIRYGREDVDAGLKVLRRMRELGAEPGRRIEAEADLRLERACERWESAA